MAQQICPHCDYRWIPRTPNPKKCPHCKRELFKTDKELERAKERQEAALLRGEQTNLVGTISYSICSVCGKPAVIRFIDSDKKKHVLCKEHGLQYFMSIKQPTEPEIVEQMNTLSKGEIPEELQNLKT